MLEDREEWREVARRAASERDPERLFELVKQLTRLLEKKHKQLEREHKEHSET